jgi:hypothetical protein
MSALTFELVRAGAAMFYSGIFWMMVWFIIENRRADPAQRRPLVPLALVLMIGSVYLIGGVMARPEERISSERARSQDQVSAIRPSH